MSKTPKKVMVLGIDCPIVPRLKKWALEGELPTLKSLIERGVYAENCLVPFPTITPPNWTTITTGAWPGTHGITDFWTHYPGTPLDETHKAFDSSEGLAERIWTAAERAEKKTIVVNYPTTWPASVGEGYQIAGYGLNVNDWRLSAPVGMPYYNNLTPDILISTEAYPFATEIEFKKAKGWEGVEHSPKALEATATLSMRRTLHKMEPVTWQILVDDVGGKGYDTVLVSRSKKKQDVFARLHVGEWSPNIYDTFQTDKGPRRGAFRCKLVELSRDASRFRLFIPGLSSLQDWGYPQSIEEEITSEEGLPMGRPGWEAFTAEWIDGETLVETLDFHHTWLADASLYLMKNKPWDLYFMHVHTPDWAYHTFSSDLEPAFAQNPDQIPDFEKIELGFYKGVDRCLGKILEAADDDALVMVVSDHGAVASGYEFNVDDVLEQAGLITYVEAKPGEKPKIDWNADIGKVKTKKGAVPLRIDWSRTKAVGQRSIHVYVNLKGRDPDGIVEPGEEYEQVREQIIKALHEYVDPATGIKPIAMALRKEDCRPLGLHGDLIGDVIYAMDPRFGKEHGPFLPTARFGMGDMRGLFIMAGPGVREGESIQRTVSLTDIVPTICYLAEIPMPRDCEGAIIYQALEDPDAKMKELQSLRRNVERYKKMIERPPMC